MNIISSLLGVVAIIIVLVGLVPGIGFINWIGLGIGIIGAVLGMFANKTSGRNINLLAIVIAIFRLLIGGGII